MLTPTFDAVVTVEASAVVRSSALGNRCLQTYSGHFDLDGISVKVLVSRPIVQTPVVQLHPPGSRIHPSGSFKISNNVFFVTASSITVVDSVGSSAINTPPSSDRPPAFLVISGTTASRATEGSSFRVVGDVEFLADGGWPLHRVAIRCEFDLTRPHLRNFNFLPDSYIAVSGALIGIIDGQYALRVHDVSFDPHEPPCTAEDFSRKCVDELASAACFWLKEVVKCNRNASASVPITVPRDEPATLPGRSAVEDTMLGFSSSSFGRTAGPYSTMPSWD